MTVFVRDEFEKQLQVFLGVEEVIAVNSGTSALIATLFAMDLQPGDEVITTPFTFIATTNAILLAGGTPIFVDVKPDSGLIDESLIEAAITPNTRAIIPVHLFGRICNMPEIKSIARKYDLFVVEDAAQSFGARCSFSCAEQCKPCRSDLRAVSPAGTFGDVGCFSFYKTKNFSTFEGGAISINSECKLDPVKIRAITNQGQIAHYEHEYIGFNFRLAEPLCLIGLEKLKLHQLSTMYELGFRDELSGHYPKLVYEQPAYMARGIKGNCPVAEELAKRIRGLGKQ